MPLKGIMFSEQKKKKADLKIITYCTIRFKKHSWNDKTIMKMKNRFMIVRRQNLGVSMTTKRSYMKNFLCNDGTVRYLYCNGVQTNLYMG